MEKECNNQDKMRGITLVALVITIVILIILATITINFAFGDEGVIDKALYAKNVTANATAYEKAQTANLLAYFDEETTADTLVEAFKEGDIKVGDYVNYTPTVTSTELTPDETGYEETQTYTTNLETTWRVLGLSEDGENLLLISGSPIKRDGENPYLVLQGATGYLECVNTLNEASSVYFNEELAEEARSIKIEDIENVLGGITITDLEEVQGGVIFNRDPSNTPVGFSIKNSSHTYKENEYTPEGALTLTHAVPGTKVESDAYFFMYDYEMYKELNLGIDKRTYDMLFESTTGGEGESAPKAYWLASPGIIASEDMEVLFSAGVVFWGAVTNAPELPSDGYLFTSTGDSMMSAAGVRTVVVLKSNITIDQIQVIPDKEEEEWQIPTEIYDSNIENDIKP